MPVLEDIYNILWKNQIQTHGKYLKLVWYMVLSTFNQRTNVNLDNKYTVLDI